VSGNNLFVANETGNTVGEYNATTGAAINASFITGLSGSRGLAFAPVPERSASSMIAIGGVLLGMTGKEGGNLSQLADAKRMRSVVS
jgi:hypothetical protein